MTAHLSFLAALAIATPLFGFSLTPPSVTPLEHGGLLRLPVFAELEDGASEPTPDSQQEAGGGELDEASEGEGAPAEDVARDPTDLWRTAEQIVSRRELASVHRAFGIATWGSMLITVGLGMIQYVNLYGFFGSREDTPCVRGGAVFGQDQCWGEPWPHRIAAITTSALYATTFVLSIAMPDPLSASEGTSEGASDLRLHRALRWVHLGGMIAQVFLGLAVGQNWLGLDRANDFEAQRALATVHQLVGLTTLGILTAAGAIMLF